MVFLFVSSASNILFYAAAVFVGIISGGMGQIKGSMGILGPPKLKETCQSPHLVEISETKSISKLLMIMGRNLHPLTAWRARKVWLVLYKATPDGNGKFSCSCVRKGRSFLVILQTLWKFREFLRIRRTNYSRRRHAQKPGYFHPWIPHPPHRQLAE